LNAVRVFELTALSGNEFHTVGAATEKARLPMIVRVRLVYERACGRKSDKKNLDLQLTMNRLNSRFRAYAIKFQPKPDLSDPKRIHSSERHSVNAVVKSIKGYQTERLVIRQYTP